MTEDQRRALALLAASPEGLPESMLVYAHGIPIEVLSGTDLLTRAEKLRRYIKTEQMVREAEKALDDVFEIPLMTIRSHARSRRVVGG